MTGESWCLALWNECYPDMGLSAVWRAAFYHTKNFLKEDFDMKEFWNTVQLVFAAVGFKGIAKKVLIFLLVGVANIIDVQVIGSGSVLRTAVIFFYISNEGVSLMENAAHLGLPVPEKLKDILRQLHDRAEDGKGDE